MKRSKCKYMILLCVLAAFLVVGALPVVAAELPMGIVVDGRLIKLDVDAMVVDGRTLVPLRGIFEALGAEVSWNGQAREVLIVKEGLRKGEKTEILMKVGLRDALTNGFLYPLDVPPILVQSRVLVPLRFLSEQMGASVAWEPRWNLVVIRSDGLQHHLSMLRLDALSEEHRESKNVESL